MTRRIVVEGGARMVSRATIAALDAGLLALAWSTLAGLVLSAFRPGSEVHVHWMGSTGSTALDGVIAAVFAALAVLRTRLALRAPLATRWAAIGVGGLVAVLIAAALTRHLEAFAGGSLRPAGLVPPATLVALALVVPWTIRSPRRIPDRRAGWRPVVRAGGVVVAGGSLVLAQIAAAGATDYRAGADAIVVLGAKVNPDGNPSDALLDRVVTACALWHEGRAPYVVLSGGHGAGAPIGEPEAMRRIARQEGVPEEALILDPAGVNTAGTIRTAAAFARDRGWSTILVVSHDYHLARVRLLAGRSGLRVRTVPAAETGSTRWKAAATLREVAAYAAAWALGI